MNIELPIRPVETKIGVYLDAYLTPFKEWLGQDDVTEILVNRPGEVWIERLGGHGMERHVSAAVTALSLGRLAHQIAGNASQAVSRQHPLLSTSLPTGERVQIILSPACRDAAALAIRKQVVSDYTLVDYGKAGAFSTTRLAQMGELTQLDKKLVALRDAGQIEQFLREAIIGRKNIIVSGGTSTGKTTFLNALIKEIPHQDRLISIEDTKEINLVNPNSLGLLAAKGDQGEARVTIEDLLQASLRMRPDRIMVGEIRGKEAYSFLRAVNTGHPGSITTVHADSAAGALEQIALMVMQGGMTLQRDEIINYVKGVVDIIVQLSREQGRRFVSEIYYEPRRH
jgi:type IV secretion system protein VirB11